MKITSTAEVDYQQPADSGQWLWVQLNVNTKSAFTKSICNSQFTQKSSWFHINWADFHTNCSVYITQWMCYVSMMQHTSLAWVVGLSGHAAVCPHTYVPQTSFIKTLVDISRLLFHQKWHTCILCILTYKSDFWDQSINPKQAWWLVCRPSRE